MTHQGVFGGSQESIQSQNYNSCYRISSCLFGPV